MEQEVIKVFIAGGTGWAGSELAKGVISDAKMELVGVLSRTHKGQDLAKVLNVSCDYIPIYDDVEEALRETEFDVFVEYTKPAVALKNILAALERGKKILVGTSGLTDEDYHEIESVATKKGTSVLAVGNFAITVVLLQKFSEIASKYIPSFEIIDYAHEDKIDAPSGTARELANRLSQVQEPMEHVSPAKLHGLKESRGAKLGGIQVHSVRLPGHVISIETIFGLKDEKLTLRHDAGASAEPYVKGALLAIRKMGTFQGLKRGLDSVMDFS